MKTANCQHILAITSDKTRQTYGHLEARKAVRHGIPGDGLAADGSELCRRLAADPPVTCHRQITKFH